MMLTRCRTCCMPTTRPDTAFIDGECSACVSYKKRPLIDWVAREAELIRILETAPKNGSGFDCIVPSSGGKDSTWQALKLIELGAKPLIVTASTCYLTQIGRENIDNLARFAMTVEITPNRTVRAKLNRIGLETVGDISWPEHVSIFTTPFRAAADFGIPLIFYGECPQEAYGGPVGTDTAQKLTKRWRSEFGGFLGLRPGDCVGQMSISSSDMADYMLPDDDRLKGITAYFLGQFYEWDSRRNAKVAKANGMWAQLPYSGNWWPEENLDNAMTGVHDYFGYLKFGYGRLCAQISIDVRSGRVPRNEAMEHVEGRDGLFPREYMNVPLSDVIEHIGMTRAEFDACCDKYTNKALFAGKAGDRLILKEFACLPAE